MLHRSGYIMYPHISWVISPCFFSSTDHGQIAQARPSVGGEQAESEKWAVWEWVYWGPRLFQSLDFGVTYFGTNLRILLPGRFPSYFRFGIVIWFINGGKLEDQLKVLDRSEQTLKEHEDQHVAILNEMIHAARAMLNSPTVVQPVRVDATAADLMEELSSILDNKARASHVLAMFTCIYAYIYMHMCM